MTQSNPKPVRLVDVAEKAGVSRIVAGHVLLGSGGKTTRVSNATAQRVRAAAADLDYRPNLIARQLSGVRTHTLAALIGADKFTIHYDRLRAIDREADRRGYRLMVGYLHDTPGETADLHQRLDEMLGRGVEGVILVHRVRDLPQPILDRLAQTAVASCQPQPEIPDANYVDVDLAQGIETLVEHLAERGRRRLALLVDTKSDTAPQPRQRGIVNACKRLKLPDPVIWSADLHVDLFDPQEVRKHVDRILDRHLPGSDRDAILASDDLWGVQVIKSLTERGLRVPDDIAVTGVDNVDIAAACIPELTTIDQCNDLVAEKVVDMMIHLIEGKRLTKKDRHVTIQPELIIRQST